MYKWIVLLTSFLFTGHFLPAQSPTTPWFTHVLADGKTESLEAFMKASKVNGLSVCVMTGLEIDTLINAGVSDSETMAPVDGQTKFQLGGMSAGLVNFLVLRTATLGKIDLDNPANDYLTSWKIPEKRFTKRNPVTVRDLLLQTRKFNLGYKPMGYESGKELPNTTQLLRGEAPSPYGSVKVVGNKNKSGNGAFANNLVIQQLLEDVWQRPIEDLLQKEVLAPLGMENSIWKAEMTTGDYENTAVGYLQDGKPIPGKRRRFAELGHSGLWATAEDYAKFAAHVFAATEGEAGSLISQELAVQATTPQFENRSLIFFKSYDLYWGGAPYGYYSSFAGKPDNGTVIVVCTNSNINWSFANTLLDMSWNFARSKTNQN